MIMGKKVSVIIPVFNGEKTIRACLDSLISGAMCDIEIIVVNDGSTDATADILNKYPADKIRVITIENSGQGFARNKGIEASTGEYVGFVDADDTVEKNMYRDMYEAAVRYGADIVQCSIKDIYKSDINVRPDIDETFVKAESASDYADRYFYTLIHTNEVCNKLFKKSFIEKNGLRFSDTRIVYSEDLKFNIDLLRFNPAVCFIKNAYYNYFISDDGHCLKNPRQRAEKMTVLYAECIKNINDRRLERCIKSMAQINILSYCAPMCDEPWVRNIAGSGQIKNYLLASLIYKKSLKHAILTACMIIAPYKIKKLLLKKYYVFEKRGHDV